MVQASHPWGGCVRSLARGVGLLVGCTVVFIAGCSRNPEIAKASFVSSGRRYMDTGKYPEAAIQFRNALKIDSRNPEAYYQLAEASLKMQRWADAFQALQQVVVEAFVNVAVPESRVMGDTGTKATGFHPVRAA